MPLSRQETYEVSPPTRGWTLMRRLPREHPVGFPRPRGDGPCDAGSAPRRPRFPRPRGDGPAASKNPDGRGQGFPRPRGDGPLWPIRSPRDGRSADRSGFPAHAGMDPSCRCTHERSEPHANGPPRDWRFPRPRGDGPQCGLARLTAADGFPAHAGMDLAVGCWTAGRRRSAGFPAHAGMDPITGRRQDHRRL